jgi:pimeloyl-ACP methyl ester carboxylesterase
MNMMPPDLSVLAIDVPGHGFSSHYPPGSMYHFTEDLVLMRRIVRHFGWKNLTIMGHSMGSIYSFVYAAVFPMDVKKIIGFDILRPVALNSKYFVEKGGERIDKFIDLILKQGKNIEYTVEDLVERQFAATNGSISKEACRILQTRGTIPSASQVGYVTLTRDIRLKIALLHSLPHEFLLELASRIKCEVLNIKFKNGPYYEKREFYEQTLKTVESSAKCLEYHEVEGTHHAHLNNPENVADIVINFLKR